MEQSVALRPTDIAALLAHYRCAGPIIERVLAGVPFVWTTYPLGPEGPAIFHGPLAPATRPKGPVVGVPMHDGRTHFYPQLSAERIEGLVQYGAVEILTWSPQPADPLRVGFARIVLARDKDAPGTHLIEGALTLQRVLHDNGASGVPVFDGLHGAAIWMPFADGPPYDDVRAWLHALAVRASEKFASLFTVEPNTHASGRIHLHVTSNAVGRFTAVPYCARGGEGFPVSVPLAWESVEGFDGKVPHAGELSAWIEAHGEPFELQVKSIGNQRFANAAGIAPSARSAAIGAVVKSHGPIVNAAIQVLQDGQCHDANDILARAVSRGLLDSSVSRKYVYTSIIEYIARARGNGRKPAIVQNADRSFRLNQPRDEWPAVHDVPLPPPTAEVQAVIERLSTTVDGGDYGAFELAVCDAFEMLGFVATHLGGQKAPDGYVDARLGPNGYRATIECKSADEGVNDPSVVEAAKYRGPFDADYSVLVARAFTGEIEFLSELKEHGVSAWTVQDLQTLLRVRANPFECMPLFDPGLASDGVDDLLWERNHGRAKRVRWIADSITRIGWAAQQAYEGRREQAPRITVDAAMMLVDQDLAAAGSTASCSRVDVWAAFDYLSSPLIARAWREGNSIMIVGP